jgi:nickel-type superoxide dismutase maturation protease
MREPGWSTVLGWMVGRVRRFQVQGRSMEPTLHPGDTVWVDRSAFRQALPVTGDLVVAKHPFRRDQRLVKRVKQVTIDGRIELIGDNPQESTDSRGLGSLDPLLLLGRVCATSRKEPIPRLPGTRSADWSPDLPQR